MRSLALREAAWASAPGAERGFAAAGSAAESATRRPPVSTTLILESTLAPSRARIAVDSAARSTPAIAEANTRPCWIIEASCISRSCFS